jgi:hypothetical protein
LEHRDFKEHRELKEFLVLLLVHKVHKVLWDNKDLKALKVHRDQ